MDHAAKLKSRADLVCILILCDQIPDRTIEGERKLLRSWVEKFLPDKIDLYDMIYESRFDRLITQFRTTSST
jgi:hypothetical protein